ncbi:MAG: lamin tail domain-containing protein, partial [FCB group bacterium]|nr:lamin tail domain-containing protein [FCB group bacterium]
DASIGNGLKNSGDSVFLIDADGDTVSSVSWQGGSDGYSLERIVLDYPEVPQNWRQCLTPNGTPGFENSVSSFTFDVALESVSNTPLYPAAFEEFSLTLRLVNTGLFDATGALKINGSFMDSVFMPVRDTVSYQSPVTGEPSGVLPYLLTITAENDYDRSNDSLWHEIRIKSGYRTLLINEIQYSPPDDGAEWCELVNISNTTVDLFEWRIADHEPPGAGINRHFQLDPGAYVVVSKDSTMPGAIGYEDFPGLNNSGDDVFLFDPTGRLIDHVQYDPVWGGGSGYSLERMTFYIDSNDPANWGTCVAPSGCTPGEVNSLYVPDMQADAALSLYPNPFSPDGDGFEDELTLAYHLPFTEATLQVELYDVRGRKIITLAPGIHSGMEGILRWDGKDGTGRKCRVGQYLLVLEASNAYSGKSYRNVARVILAKKLN